MNFLKNFFSKPQFEFVSDTEGLHLLGGEIPSNFKIPKNEFLGGFQYLGFINNSDKHFSWLPFSLHLICPIFTDFEYIFLDYTNPNEPKIISPVSTSEITSAYYELKKDSYIIYHKENFSLKEFKGINDDNEFDVVAVAGKPHWSQFPNEPVLPKSNKKMKFVCQLMSNGPIKVKEKNFKSDDEYYEKIFSELNFWCDGDLKIFFDPDSKIACYFIQNT